MCGIAGFWQSRRGADDPREVLTRMAAALEHRGPDDAGAFYDCAAGIGMAFRRLSILDLSPEGHQPMYSASGRYVIVFNGEVYNFKELRAELGEQHWRGGSDTEVMLGAIERWGLHAAVRRFVGMFAFALWDTVDTKLYLVRDRLGIKPLYYGLVGSDLVFASELKAIVEYPAFARDVDRDALTLYMRHNYIPSPHSIYKGVAKLQPGCILALDSPTAVAEICRYWSAGEIAHAGIRGLPHMDDTEAIEELHRLLINAVRLRMVADVPLGAFLSGGVDSSAVAALMQAQSARPIKTFTIGFHEEGYNEAAHAKKVAERLKTDHTELYLTSRDALEVVPLLPRMYDEPFSDSSQIPTYLVSKLARRTVTVSLSGDGGDELFGGYDRYLTIRKIWKYSQALPQSLKNGVSRALQKARPHIVDEAFRVLRPLLPKGLRIPTPGHKLQKLSAFLSEDNPEALYYQALTHWGRPSRVVIGGNEPGTIRECMENSSFPGGIEETMMLTDLLTYLPDDILTKLDRASMAVSLEARTPLLDHRIVEFAWSLPLRMKIRGDQGKWLLRQVLYRYVPRELIDRPKFGFGIPLDRWLRGPLRDWAEALLDERRLRREGYFEAHPVRMIWAAHLHGEGSWQHCLWDVLMFQSWLEANQKHSATTVSTALTAS